MISIYGVDLSVSDGSLEERKFIPTLLRDRLLTLVQNVFSDIIVSALFFGLRLARDAQVDPCGPAGLVH